MQTTSWVTILLSTISTREIALSLWIGVPFILLVLMKQNIRHSTRQVIRALSSRYMLSMVSIILIYVVCIVWFLYRIGFWNVYLLKSTIIWFFAVATVSFLKINKIESVAFYRATVQHSINWGVLFLFFINFYTFTLSTELIIVPILILFVLLKSFVDVAKKPEYETAKTLSTWVVGIISVVYIINAVYRLLIIADYTDLFTLNTLKELILTFVLTLLYIPILYVITLWVNYLTAFAYLNYTATERDQRRLLKKKIWLIAKFRISPIVRIRKKLNTYELPSIEAIANFATTPNNANI